MFHVEHRPACEWPRDAAPSLRWRKTRREGRVPEDKSRERAEAPHEAEGSCGGEVPEASEEGRGQISEKGRRPFSSGGAKKRAENRSGFDPEGPLATAKRKRTRQLTGWSAASRHLWPLLVVISLKVLDASVSFFEEGERWRLEYSPGRGAPAGVDSRVLLGRQR